METIKASPRSEGESSFRMIDVSDKVATRRRAVAQGKILLAREAFVALRDQTNPKGDVLALAEVAGIMAAKKTADLIPLCHPLPLQSVRVSFRLEESESAVTVFCEAITSARTGVEMEALCGVQGALLSIYDLSKAVHPAITMGEIRLNLKEGGKSGLWTHPEFQALAIEKTSGGEKILEGIPSAVLTVSDRVSRGQAQDQSGPVIESALKEWGGEVLARAVVPDDEGQIQAFLREMILEKRVELIITTGGTGLSPRDVTPEAIQKIADRIIPGFGECLRKEGAWRVPTAWLSRSLGALIGNSLVVALPGNSKAVAEGLEALEPILAHALHIARGGNHDSVR